MMMTDSLSIHGNIKFYMCKHAFFSKKSCITDSILTIYFKVLCICGKTTSILMLNIYLSFQCVFFKNRNKLLQFNSSIFSIAYHEMIKALVITTAGNPGLSGIHYQAGLARSCCYHWWTAWSCCRNLDSVWFEVVCCLHPCL